MCQNAEIEMNQTHRVNIFFFLKEVPGTLHDRDSVDAGMNTSYQKSLVACKIEELWGMGTEWQVVAPWFQNLKWQI